MRMSTRRPRWVLMRGCGEPGRAVDKRGTMSRRATFLLDDMAAVGSRRWREALPLLRPGGHLVDYGPSSAFTGGSRPPGQGAT